MMVAPRMTNLVVCFLLSSPVHSS
uniref:Uncharacterized protein n=1 Tax=Anguilla anguilla TaxID=7936 RepID=A0A0E9UYU0_ANGAN